MAYNYLDLVNGVCHLVNETPLTSSNFSTASGFYRTAKDAVNSSIRHINQDEFHWPFNHSTYDETLVAGQIRYDYQADAKSVDYDSFRIQRSDSFGNETQKLRRIDYQEYLEKLVDDEYNTSDTGIRSIPRYVFRTPNQDYGVWPAPDNAYILTYEYYKLPTDLEAYDDVPSIPVAFKTLIVNGAMYYVTDFRGDTESMDRYFSRFTDGLKQMRKIYINPYHTMSDRRVANWSPRTTLDVNT